MTTKVGLTNDGSQAKGLKYSEKNTKVLTNLEQILKRKIVGLNSKPKSKQNKLTRALKNNRFLPGGCYFFKIV
jgi:ribosomal protein S18